MEAGYTDFGQVRTDPDLTFLRADARFEVGAPATQQLTQHAGCINNMQISKSSEAFMTKTSVAPCCLSDNAYCAAAQCCCAAAGAHGAL